MVSPSPTYETSPPLTSPPAPSFQSQASSSSHPIKSSYPHQQQQQQNSNLPVPPPADRQPPAKNRNPHHINGGQRLNKILRKGKERDKSTHSTGDIEEDWTLEGITPPSSHNASGNGSTLGPRRTSADTADTARSLENDVNLNHERQPIDISPKEDMEKKEKKSKGRGIVKKTSRLFARDKDKDKASEYDTSNGNNLVSNGGNSLNPIPGSRQPSYSSTYSSDSQTTTATSIRSNNHFPTLNRPISNQSRARSPKDYQTHGRRASQDSNISWRSKSFRSGSSPQDSSSNEIGVPIPSRQGSNMSASVPGLSRNSLPQPAGGSSSSSSSNQQQTSRSPETTFPSRMSTWFSHLLPSTSSTTIQEGSSISSPTSSSESPPQLPPSPLRKPPSAAASFLNAARQRAVDGVRHLLDTEAQPDKCQDTIWVMGVGHPGWRPSTPSRSPNTVNLPEISDNTSDRAFEERRGSAESGITSPSSQTELGALRPSAWSKKQKDQPSSTNPSVTTSPPTKGFSNLFTASTLSLSLPASMTSGSPSKEGGTSVADSPGKVRNNKKDKETLKWPDQFYDDFRSVVWCTYRSQYAPILSLPNNLLIPSPEAYYSAFGPPADSSSTPSEPIALSSAATAAGLSTRPSGTGWSWARSEGGLTSDAGWGCMLRTGQSMLANALVHLHLGRDWRVPPKPSSHPTTPSDLGNLQRYTEYAKIVSWFMDDPSPLCPFSVHRMALIGKELGKEVGEWFGPSTAAGALKTLTNSFGACGLAVSTATDSIVYKSEVYQASNLPSRGWESPLPPPTDTERRGGRVSTPRRSSASTGKSGNVWGDKAVLVLVGIRLGLDGVNPIYYESIKALFTFPQSVGIAGGRPSSSYYFVGSQANSLFYLDPHLTRPAVPLEIPPAPASSPSNADSNEKAIEEEPVVVDALEAGIQPKAIKYKLDVVDVDDISSEESSDGDVSSSPSTGVNRRYKTSKQAKRLSAKGITPTRPTSKIAESEETPRAATAPNEAGPSTPHSTLQHPLDPLPVSAEMSWWANAYPDQALKTFHCEKVKKMPLSGLDPSMLLGFLVRNEEDWEDFVERAGKLPHKIFSVQDEPPSWDADSDAGLESVSEPGEPSLDDEEIENVPITSNRQDHSPTTAFSKDSDDIEDEDVDLISANTTVGAVDIVRKTRKMGLGDDEGDEEEWTEGGTPQSQRPVLVERPTPTPTSTTSRQASWPKPNSSSNSSSTAAKPLPQMEKVDLSSSNEGKSFPASPPNKGNPKDMTKRPLLEDQRYRTESWIDPSPVNGEAPNGDSML
ncbi:uncharacterized protein IL334_000633 [Kwoniella shivajii]|uniref:Autophagy-related protein 4 n=1 Tax=Kwoniella shivajii TaxID=564305 RepID=A0ABZ1CR74_9TREE|nr:hypothetical protein IL334_000633 [Kwoniella shivajii]